MRPHLHTEILHASPVVVIRDVLCRAAPGHGRHVERASSDDIVFPRSGAFVREARGGESFADATVALFFNRGESYRVTHPIEGGDECTTFAFAPEVLAEAIGRSGDPPPGGAPIFTHAVAPVGPREYALLHRLRARLTAGHPSALAADEMALDLLARAVEPFARENHGSTRPRRATTARAHRETAHAVRALLAHSYGRDLTLDAIALAVHTSPFHLARLYKRETGGSIHRHLLHLRLRAALRHLAEGADDLAALALDLGFSSQSHLTDAFRRAFGVPPAALRRELGRSRLQTSRILEASSPARRVASVA
jgi:AraC-like DNA-binding protein